MMMVMRVKRKIKMMNNLIDKAAALGDNGGLRGGTENERELGYKEEAENGELGLHRRGSQGD